MVEQTQAAAAQALVVGATEWLTDINNAITEYENKVVQLASNQETMRRINAGEISVTSSYLEALRHDLEVDTERLNNLKRSIDVTLALSGQKYEGGVIKDIIDPNAADRVDETVKTFQQMLSGIEKSETQHLNERISQVKSFLEQRAGLEGASGADRIEFYRNQLEELKKVDTERFNGTLASEEAIKEAVKEYITNMSDMDKNFQRETNESDLAFWARKKQYWQEQQTEMLAIFEEGSAEYLAAKAAFGARQLEADRQSAATRTAAAREAMEAFKEQLESTVSEEQRAQEERIEAVKSFLQQRDGLEADDHAGRIAFLEERKAELLALYEEGSLERVAVELAADAAIKKSREHLAESERELLEQRLAAASGFFGALAGLISASDEKSKEAFYIARALASAEAFINSYLAFTQTLADKTMPTLLKVPTAAGILASGIAAQASIWKQQPPSAETGGRFIVPDVSPRVDGAYMRFNGGEEVDVTPRGMAANSRNAFNFKFVFNDAEFASIINRLARNGELYTLQLAANL